MTDNERFFNIHYSFQRDELVTRYFSIGENCNDGKLLKEFFVKWHFIICWVREIASRWCVILQNFLKFHNIGEWESFHNSWISPQNLASSSKNFHKISRKYARKICKITSHITRKKKLWIMSQKRREIRCITFNRIQLN